MKTVNLRRILMGSISLGLLISLIGCSGKSPVAPLAGSGGSTNGGGFFNSATSTELYGRVASIDPTAGTMTLTGNPTVITVAAGAELVRREHGVETPITLFDINVGDSAEVHGDMNGGGLLADRVRIRIEDGPGAEVEVRGRIATVDAVARTLGLAGDATVYNVSPNAEIVQKTSGVETPIELGQIMVGDSVEVKGNAQADGSVLLSRIRVKIEDLEDMRAEVEFTARIATIDYAAGTFTVEGHSETIVTDSNTAIFMKANIDSSGTPAGKPVDGSDGEGFKDEDLRTPIAFTDLRAGDFVEVHANRIDASTLYAVAVELEDGAAEDGLEVEFKANLASVDPVNGLVTFDGQAWIGVVVSGADLRGLMDEPLTLFDFVAGQLVEVAGFRQTGDTLQVVKMHRDNN